MEKNKYKIVVVMKDGTVNETQCAGDDADRATNHLHERAKQDSATVSIFVFVNYELAVQEDMPKPKPAPPPMTIKPGTGL